MPKNTNITGVIVNKLNAPVDEQGRTRPDLSEIFDDSSKAKVNNVDPAKLQESSPLPVLGAVPWSFDLIATRAIDMARHLNATIINEATSILAALNPSLSAHAAFRTCWSTSVPVLCW